jgi:hypothetical protein
VDELQTSVETAKSERDEAAQQRHREADAARDRRDSERQERAQARADAAERAAAGEPLPVETQPAQAGAPSKGSKP